MADRKISQGVHFRKASFDIKKLEGLIGQGYAAQIGESKVKKKESFAPSSIGSNYGGTCPRFWYMAFTGTYEFEQTTDPMGQANMDNGTESGVRIANVFGSVDNFLVSTEVEFFMKDPPVRGFIDALVRLDDEILVCEIKTTKQELFMYRKNSMKPTAPHLYQILLYMRATGKKNGFLFYENRNTNEYILIPVTMDEHNNKILDDALDWLREVRANWEAEGDTLPTRPFTKKSVQCKNCPLFNECWNNLGLGMVTIKPMAVVKP